MLQQNSKENNEMLKRDKSAVRNAWNEYPTVLPEDGSHILLKYTPEQKETSNVLQTVLGIFEYDAPGNCFKNAEGAALTNCKVVAWAPLV